MLRVRGLTRAFHLGGQEIRALDGVDLTVSRGELVRVVGASGSGKSTLLNLLGGLDRPSSGAIETPLGNLATASRAVLARWRADHVGMVFQSYNLIAHRTALSNVELGLAFGGVARRERVERARRALESLGLAGRLDHRPADLSGGERQRVAFARALVKDPDILLADEPTGNLDRANATAIVSLLRTLNEAGTTIVLVTHDPCLAEELAHRTVHLSYGTIAAIEVRRSAEGSSA